MPTFFDGKIGQDKRRIQRIGFPLQVGIGYRLLYTFSNVSIAPPQHFGKAGIANRSVIHERFAALQSRFSPRPSILWYPDSVDNDRRRIRRSEDDLRGRTSE